MLRPAVDADRVLPFTESPFESDDHLEKGVEDVFGDCVREGYDAQITYDQKCQKIDLCHLGWTEASRTEIIVPLLTWYG